VNGGVRKCEDEIKNARQPAAAPLMGTDLKSVPINDNVAAGYNVAAGWQ
jgi:hypothetical protein